MPIAIIFSKGGDSQVIPMAFKDEEEKWNMHFKLGVICVASRAEFVITVNDVAMKSYGPDYDINAPMDITERPLMYPKSMRTEAILLSYLNLETKERNFLMQAYKDTNGIEFLENPDIPSDKMQSNLLDIVHQGYDKATEQIISLKASPEKIAKVIECLGVESMEEITPELLEAHRSEIKAILKGE